MFKAIKDKKIIAINNSGDFPCLICDETLEDKEHNIEDYEQYDGEFLLKSEIPAPSDEEIRELRAQAYLIEVDPITAHIQRLRDTDQITPEIEAEITALIIERDTKVAEIKAQYPYNEVKEDDTDIID